MTGIPKTVVQAALPHRISVKLENGIYSIWKPSVLEKKNAFIVESRTGALARIRQLVQMEKRNENPIRRVGLKRGAKKYVSRPSQITGDAPSARLRKRRRMVAEAPDGYFPNPRGMMVEELPISEHIEIHAPSSTDIGEFVFHVQYDDGKNRWQTFAITDSQYYAEQIARMLARSKEYGGNTWRVAQS